MSVMIQRWDGDGVSRRGFLRAAGLGGIAGLGGCLRASSAAGSGTVDILSAGSLQHAFEGGLEAASDHPIQIEAHGSATLARMIAEGQRDPDIVTVADTALFERPLSPSWYAEFASNAVVLVYNPTTEGGRRIAEAGSERWYEPLIAGEVSLGRTDPDQDPLGYRALFALELADRYYAGAADLREQILDRDQIYPESGLLTQFETGAIDAALAYRNMAVERDYAYVDLPDRIDLSNPEFVEDWYSTVSYELPSGQEIRGGLISYATTVRRLSDAAVAVFDVLTTGDYLDESGVILRDQFPRYAGTVPAQVRQATTDSPGNRSRHRSPEPALLDTGSTDTRAG